MRLVALVERGVVEGVRAVRGRVAVERCAAVVVTEHHLVIVVDVPVEACQNVRRPSLGGVLAEIGRIVTRQSLVLFADLRELLLSGEAFDVVRIVNRRGGLVLVVLAAYEEEQLVLYDGTAEGHAIGLGGLLGILLAFGAFAHQVVVFIIGIGRTAERVVTRLGHRVDTAARETALANVVRGDYHLNLLDGLHRDGVGARLAAVGSRSGEAEHVVRHGAVDLERVVTVVGSRERDSARRALGRARQGAEARDVRYAAVDRRQILYHAAREVRGGSRLIGVEAAVGRAYDHDGVELLSLLELHVERTGLAEAEGNAGQLHRLVSHIRNGKRVGTARTHTLQVVASVGIGDCAVLRSRRSVHGDDGGSHQRFALLVGNLTVHARCGGLRAQRANHHGRDDQ